MCSALFSALGGSKEHFSVNFLKEEVGVRVLLVVMASYLGIFVLIISKVFVCVSTETRQFGTVSDLKRGKADKRLFETIVFFELASEYC